MRSKPSVKLIGGAPAFLDVLRQISEIADIQAPVLIEGETGTGKELVARALHYSSPRAAMPFIPVNCGALPESLIENELFGHCRGAYTDAREPQMGLITQAQNGTLFLDEIDALPYRGQVALLRFLQDFCYRPLGGTQDVQAELRVVVATNVNLDQLVAQKQFRPDLYFRLKIFAIKLPPLRARHGDAKLLAEHFATVYSQQYGIEQKPIAPADLAWVDSYDWPGNVRELENLVHNAVVRSRSTRELVLKRLSPLMPNHLTPMPTINPVWTQGFQRAKADAVLAFERSFIEYALTECHGNVSAAARLSGKERRAFGKLVKKHGLDKRQFID